MQRISFFLLLIFGFIALHAQTDTPASTDDIMKTAYTGAAKSNKKIFLVYHASWCKWCKKLDSALTSTELKPVFDKYFIISHLDVNERKEKVELLENTGGRELLKSHGGENAGLPYYVVLNAKGKKLADSKQMPDTSNIGYPGAPDEIKLFTRMLKKSVPAMKKKDVEIILEYLKKHAPAH